MVSLAACLASINNRLRSTTETPGLDAQVLLAHILGVERTWVLSHPEAELNALQQQALASAVSRLESGESLPYVLGVWEFYGLPFSLTPHVLIPRPETELMVEKALSWLAAHPDRRQAADIGTGSGCIAISLATKINDLRVTAADISFEAIQVASINVQRHRVSNRVWLAQSDLMAGLEESFDLICANLPYIPTATLQTLAVYHREPVLALDGGEHGLDLIVRLLQQAPSYLSHGGLLLLEIESSQGVEVTSLARQAFPAAEVSLTRDLAGHDRVVSILS